LFQNQTKKYHDDCLLKRLLVHKGNHIDHPQRYLLPTKRTRKTKQTMPPKKKADAASKKTVQKKKQQAIEDKTFGLKNKNKSKKIQQFVQSVERNVMNSGDPAQRKAEEARKKAREEAKLRKKLLKDEQDALFGEALLAVQKKSSTSQTSGKIEAKGRDGDDDENATKKTTSRAMKMMYQMDAQEMNEKLREDVRRVSIFIFIHVFFLLFKKSILTMK
jgi:hypothetical protein